MKECMETGNSEKKLHYNFVIFFVNTDYHRVLLGKELYESEKVRVYESAIKGPKLLQKLFHYHWAYSINRRVKLPFKRIWFRRMYNQDFKNDLPLCFVYLGGNMIRYDGGWTEYVRKKDPRNRQVIMHGDLISKKIDYDYSIIRNKVDLAVTYDMEEAKQYGIHWFQSNTYSKLIPEPEKPDIRQDVYFLGNAKDRLPKILAVYKKLHDNGVKCLFQIAGVPEKDRVNGEGIEYITSVSYEENLQNVIHSKCLLELIQGESANSTPRTKEAISYRRRLLTDCKNCNADNFNPGQLQIFDDPEKIDVDFIKADFDPNEYPQIPDTDPFRRLIDMQEQMEGKANG